MDRKLPIGLGRDGSPIYINLDFLDGTRVALIPISGISGVATKTRVRRHTELPHPAKRRYWQPGSRWGPGRDFPRRFGADK